MNSVVIQLMCPMKTKKVKIKNFNLGLKVAGKVQCVLSVVAKDLREAKDTWAWLTGHCDPMWDVQKQTYFGWQVVQTKTKALQRKDCKLIRWQY